MNQSLVDFKDRLTTDADFYQKFKKIETVEEFVRTAAAGGLTTPGIAGNTVKYVGIAGKQ